MARARGRQSPRFYLGAGFFLLAGLSWFLVSIMIPHARIVFMALGLAFFGLATFWIRKAMEAAKKGN